MGQIPHLALEVGREGKKFCELLAGSPRVAAAILQRASNLGQGRAAARGSRAPSSPALRAQPRALRVHGRALTWHLLLSVQVVAVFTWVFKQVSGTKKEGKKIQLCKWAPAWEARAGSAAATVRVLEQPRTGQIYAGASRLRQVPPPEHLEVN